MEYLILWAVGAIIVGMIGSNTTLGFGGAFLLSVILSPVIGFIIVLFYPSKKYREKQLQEQQKQTQLLQSLSSERVSHADEITKLKKQLDDGIITASEFQLLKDKIISS